MSMNKLERKRYNRKLRNRRFRARKAEQAQEQEWVEPAPLPPVVPQVPKACISCARPANFSFGEGKNFCADHGRDYDNRALRAAAATPSESAVDLPTTFTSLPARPERNLFDPATDRWRPSFWSVIDPHPAPIEISLSPRTVARSNRIRPSQPDPGIVFTEADGHIDIAARQAEQEEQKWKDVGR